MKPLRFVSADPQIDLEVPVGNFGAALVGGLGGYQEVERQDDVSAVDWTGQEALRQDISVLLDGYATGDPVDRELNTLLKLGRDPNGERVPPVFKVYGPVYFEDKQWVLPSDGIDLNGGEIETIRRHGDGALLRQEVILHLLEYNPPGVIKLRKAGSISANVAVGGTYITQKGDTLHSIAAHLLNDASLWKEIGDPNGLTDPNRKLPAGKVLKIR